MSYFAFVDYYFYYIMSAAGPAPLRHPALTSQTPNSLSIIPQTMSWSGFKKAVNRGATQVLLKTGQIEQTQDREFDIEERRFHAVEAASAQLQVEARGYLDSLRAMTSAQVKMAETIDLFYGDSGVRDNVSRHYLTAVQELDTETIKHLDEPYRITVMEPVERFCSYFVDINEAIKKRQHRLLDYDRHRARTQRLVDHPSKDATKLPMAEREEQTAREAYSSINDQLTAELPQLLDLRVPYLDPSFEALVKIQLQFCSESYTKLAEIQQFLEPQTRDDYASGQLDTYVEQALMQMQELTIVNL